MNQLPPTFQLPDFLRVTWASQPAQAAWQPRLNAIRDTWPRVAMDLVSAGAVGCVLRTVPPWTIFRLYPEAKRHGVSIRVLGVRGLAVPSYARYQHASGDGRPFCYDVVIGNDPETRLVEHLWEKRDYLPAYRLAGVPECCVEALREDIFSHRIDSTGRLFPATENVEAGVDAVPDPLWRCFHIERASFVPCAFDCANAGRLCRQWIDTAMNSGYESEMTWLGSILSWPVEWTALHGIAEVKTPILKFACTTDATNRKEVLRYLGKGYPGEGATGLRFPYHRSEKPALTSSASVRQGLENLIKIQ